MFYYQLFSWLKFLGILSAAGKCVCVCVCVCLCVCVWMRVGVGVCMLVSVRMYLCVLIHVVFN